MKMSFFDRLFIPTYDNQAYAHSGRVRIDPAKCVGCGMCATICPGKAIRVEGQGKKKKAQMEPDFPQCMSCNDCAAICERGAITVCQTYDFGYHFKILDRSGMEPPRNFKATD
jgi:formate hydrogenlyase subunit 6/NADH:ubiquinone oxidoreductase subunit I